MGKIHGELCGISMNKHKNKDKCENGAQIETYDDKFEELGLLRNREASLTVAECVDRRVRSRQGVRCRRRRVPVTVVVISAESERRVEKCHWPSQSALPSLQSSRCSGAIAAEVNDE